MTWFQAYAFFGAPLIVLFIGLGVAYIAGRDGNRTEPGATPGE
jgi:hypothetical protein